MEYRALYRQARPEVFSEIIGQDHIVRILRHQIATDTVSHAYLFCGTRGTGKTTTARILAKALNCTGTDDPAARPCGTCPACRAIAEGKFIDVIEIDAASNNGVENVRDLRESVNYPPAVGRKKVYIIDEVHMLSQQAFNALLKTLEEPPENVVFILATTNPEKLLQTVVSRCIRLDFKRVPARLISDHMKDLCRERGVEISDDALRLLAANADGSVRDSLSILEQCLSTGEKTIDRDTVLDFLGTLSADFFLDITEKVMTKDISRAFILLDEALRDGKDVKQLMKDWMAHFRSLLIAKYVPDVSDMLNISEENITRLKKQSDRIELAELNHAIITLAKAINDARYSTQARILMEVSIVTIASGMEYGKPLGEMSSAAAPAKITRSERLSQDPPSPATGNKTHADTAVEKPFEEPVLPQNQDDRPDISNDLPGEEKPGAGNKNDGSEQMSELAEIWREVSEEAYKRNPMLSVLNRAMLVEIGEKQFKLIASGATTKKLIEREKDLVCELMEFQVGRRLGMVIRGEEDLAGEKTQEELEAIAKDASALLDIEVKIR